jgi:hypothetical protein
MSKAILAIVPVVIIGAVAGLGFAGIIKIPGITPKKALANAAKGYVQTEGKAPVVAKTEPKTPTKAADDPAPTKLAPKPAKKDLDQGADALASVWNEIKTPELLKISANWKDDDLAIVLSHMDTSLVAKFLDEMAKGGTDKPNPMRASKLSKILQDQGSIVKSVKS